MSIAQALKHMSIGDQAVKPMPSDQALKYNAQWPGTEMHGQVLKHMSIGQALKHMPSG